VEAGTPLAIVQVRAPADDRARWVRRARLLAWAGVGWHGIEAAVAVGAGLAAGSFALIGFGADSLIEAAAGLVVLWLFAAPRAGSAEAEARAQKLIAVSFYVLAAYIGAEAVRSLVGGHHPEVSWVGIGLSGVTLLTMPPLAAAKATVADRLGSSATRSESRQTMLCAYLSAALLVGRPVDRARDRGCRGPGGTRGMARRELLHGAGRWRRPLLRLTQGS
jgi:divalent metal cation (Fe/Co/Zn/Cd) transporter